MGPIFTSLFYATKTVYYSGLLWLRWGKWTCATLNALAHPEEFDPFQRGQDPDSFGNYNLSLLEHQTLKIKQILEPPFRWASTMKTQLCRLSEWLKGGGAVLKYPLTGIEMAIHSTVSLIGQPTTMRLINLGLCLMPLLFPETFPYYVSGTSIVTPAEAHFRHFAAHVVAAGWAFYFDHKINHRFTTEKSHFTEEHHLVRSVQTHLVALTGHIKNCATTTPVLANAAEEALAHYRERIPARPAQREPIPPTRMNAALEACKISWIDACVMRPVTAYFFSAPLRIAEALVNTMIIPYRATLIYKKTMENYGLEKQLFDAKTGSEYKVPFDGSHLRDVEQYLRMHAEAITTCKQDKRFQHIGNKHKKDAPLKVIYDQAITAEKNKLSTKNIETPETNHAMDYRLHAVRGSFNNLAALVTRRTHSNEAVTQPLAH